MMLEGESSTRSSVHPTQDSQPTPHQCAVDEMLMKEDAPSASAIVSPTLNSKGTQKKKKGYN